MIHCCTLLDFLCEFYYDAWIHERQVLKTFVDRIFKVQLFSTTLKMEAPTSSETALTNYYTMASYPSGLKTMSVNILNIYRSKCVRQYARSQGFLPQLPVTYRMFQQSLYRDTELLNTSRTGSFKLFKRPFPGF